MIEPGLTITVLCALLAVLILTAGLTEERPEESEESEEEWLDRQW